MHRNNKQEFTLQASLLFVYDISGGSVIVRTANLQYRYRLLDNFTQNCQQTQCISETSARTVSWCDNPACASFSDSTILLAVSASNDSLDLTQADCVDFVLVQLTDVVQQTDWISLDSQHKYCFRQLHLVAQENGIRHTVDVCHHYLTTIFFARLPEKRMNLSAAKSGCPKSRGSSLAASSLLRTSQAILNYIILQVVQRTHTRRTPGPNRPTCRRHNQ